MDLKQLNIVVLGAGIGGLAVARALALRGATVTVLEQAHEITEVGAGLQISPNGLAVLRGLGLESALMATAPVRARAVCLHDFSGADVLRLDLDRHGRDQPHLCVHRADLIAVLAAGARAAGVQIRLLQKVKTVHPGAVPEVETSSGARLRADLVIGADGLHSRLRAVLAPKLRPVFTGQVAWRAVLHEPTDPLPEVRLYMGPHRHLVTYPLRGGGQRNIVAVEETKAWTEERWSQVGDPEVLSRRFADFGPEVQRLLGRVGPVHRWGLFRHPVVDRWHGPGVALLGDAAHPTLPFMAQGACLALEDAWVLADALAQADGRDAGLAAYQAARRDRARRVVAVASRNAWKYHLSLPPLRAAAHAALRLGGRLAPAAMLHQFDWIYRHDVTGGVVLADAV
ncbi:FAD-dependent monooxygenase [Pseudooceanicola sp.]|uniref:FAD-dependent monooxygenase n=1 Tax=Pseudooceanicola sp. TaxID=1914328 RepID=UPI0026369ED1|nr:FAD-dependent monooxygenase [Pseudooceanicola sp.]MDF1854117.1 FAD-dependent monooxygenase [Pseudooceanicola sp.]